MLLQVFSAVRSARKDWIDLPGEAGTIMHQKKDIGPVELGNDLVWTVLSDHADPSGGNGVFLINGGQVRSRRILGWKWKMTVLCCYFYRKENRSNGAGFQDNEGDSRKSRFLKEAAKRPIEGYHIGGKTADFRDTGHTMKCK